MDIDCIEVNVPRQEFLGWMISVASFKAAGVGEVLMTFHAGQLSLLAEWGQTGMTYEGDFNGTVRINSKGLGGLVARHQPLMQVRAPLKLQLEPGGDRLSMEAGSVPAVILAAPGSSAPARAVSASPVRASSLQVKLKAAAIQAAMKKIFPRSPAKKALLSVAGANGRLSLQSGTQEVSIPVDSKGQGQFLMPATSFAQVLTSYPGETMLELEASEAGLRVNTFKMPVNAWNASTTLRAGA